MRDLDIARSDDVKNHAVEGVIKAVINHECKTP
jgi:hypothetical protein